MASQHLQVLKAPKVSVLVPTYNYARFLAEAIESVLAQQFTDFELLVVDDASIDHTAAVAQTFAARDPRIQVTVHPVNTGMVNNWNYCLKQARGEFVKFLFGDDRLCGPTALGRMVSLLEAHPSASLAASARIIFDDQSRVLDLYRDLPDGLHEGRSIITSVLLANGKNLVGEPSAVLFRKKDGDRGFDPRYRQVVDVEMWFHLLEKGDLIYTGEPLCAFRSHALQETERNTASGLALKEHALFFSKYAVRPEMPRKVILPLLFALRRISAVDPFVQECQRRLIQRWGRGWHAPYWFYCLRYRLAKPFRNFLHSLLKRRFRRRYPVISNSAVSF
jgi:glycosyltransferase involved in cell wall biosynthesis